MRARRSAEARTIDLLKLTQDFVVGVSSGLASGLIAISCYNEVAVEGVPAKAAVYRKLGDLRSYLAGLLEGGDGKSLPSQAMSLLSRLYEIDLESRQRWIQLGITLAISLSVLASFLASYRMYLDPLLPLVFLPLYFLLPSFAPIEVPDPVSADAIASDLEAGSGKVYAMRHLGIYERMIVDDAEVEIPKYFKCVMTISDREILASLMRKTANTLRDLMSLIDSWYAGIRSLRRIFLALVVLMAGVNLGIYILSGRIFLNPPLGFLFTSGLISSILASKPLNCPLESSLVYTTSFFVGKSLLSL